MSVIRIDRREFLQLSAAAGAGLILGFPLHSDEEAEPGGHAVLAPGAFLELDGEGAVRIWISRQEMGQGVRTSFAMIVAEELDADWSQIELVQAPLDEKYGPQRTGGSLSIRELWEPLRRVGATAREMLLIAAARRWDVPRESLTTRTGAVEHRSSSRTATYAELVEDAATLEVPTEVTLKETSTFTIVGRAMGQIDGRDIVTGKTVFGADVRVPGMLYASIERCPVMGGVLKTFDARAARRVPGVRAVFPVDGRPHSWMLQWTSGVAVVATSTWAAMRGREALEIEWEEGPHAQLDQEGIIAAIEPLLGAKGTVGRSDGDVDGILDQGEEVIEADYFAPYLSHSPMETMNAVADVREKSCEIWAPCQFPNIAQAIAQRVTGLPGQAVRVNITRLGGGFGRRIYADYVGEAVMISKQMKAPVQLLWTRIDDTRHGFYRPLSLHRMTAVLGEEGDVKLWRHRIAGPSRDAVSGPDVETPERSEIYAANELPYRIPNVQVEFSHHYVPLPCGPWRAVAYSQTGFVVESFVDELAHAAKQDPVAFRLRMLDREPFDNGDTHVDPRRMKRLLEFAAAKARWGETKLPRGRGRGVAITWDHGSGVAHIAEVSVDREGSIRVERFISAVDCGIVVNPRGVAAQVEGAVAFALSAVMKGEITIRKGRVEQSSYADYDVIRMGEMPKVELHILPSDAEPGGMGEPPLPGVAAAVVNAIHAATGRRIRRLPVGRVKSEREE